MRRIKILAAAAVLVALTAATALALSGGNPRKGKLIYRKSCRPCHVEGAPGGVMTPLSKTMGQWERFFSQEGHPAVPGALGDLNEQGLLDVRQFLHDHAADSDQPQTCG